MKTIAIASGKGGVGKTNLTANLGVALAERGKRVVLLDADFGLANLDVVLGVRATRTLRDVVAGECGVFDALTDAPFGARVLAGCSGVSELADLEAVRLKSLLEELSRLEKQTDYLLLDVAAGVSSQVMSVLEAADEVLLVVTPDPASVVDAYATVKRLVAQRPTASIYGVVNQVANDSEAVLLLAKLQAIVRDYLGAKIDYAGSIRRDDAIHFAIRGRQPFLCAIPDSMAATDVKALADRYAPREGGAVQDTKAHANTGFFQRLLGFGRRNKAEAA